MRRRHTISGPLILIGIGVLFLLHTISPEFQIFDVFAKYWPYFLIVWGVVQLIEVAIWATRDHSESFDGMPGGGWIIVLLICFAGFTMYEFQKPGAWWRQATFERGVEMFGNERDFSVPPLQKTAGDAPHIVIENFRGDAKITGGGGNTVTVSGHKLIRALDAGAAARVDQQTPVEVLVQGKTIVIRCNQEHAGARSSVTTNLELSVPKGASVEATGANGDFSVESLQGDVDISSDNAGVRVQDVSGNVHVDTRKSDEIRCENVGGNVVLRGHGDDISLSKVAGEVSVEGDYTGVVDLSNIKKGVRIGSMRTEFAAQRVDGEIKLARGSLDGHGLTGPVKVTTRATDVALTDFTDQLDLNVDKGDIDLRPQHQPLSKMLVHTGSGDIAVALPEAALFALTAATDHGSINSQLGSAFEERTEGQQAHLNGSTGTGPTLDFSTNRGDISVRKDNGTHSDGAKHADAAMIPDSNDN